MVSEKKRVNEHRCGQGGINPYKIYTVKNHHLDISLKTQTLLK